MYTFNFIDEEIDGKLFLTLNKSDFRDMNLKFGTIKQLEEIQNWEKVG